MITGGGGGNSTPAFAFGTAAARPAAASGNADTGYFATDSGEVTFSDGSAWHSIAHTTGSFSANANVSAGNDINLQGSGLMNESAAAWLVQNVDLSVHSTGRGLKVAEGTSAKQGVATLAAGTVVVANTSVTVNSRIVLTAQDNNTSGALRVSARTAGTSFTITSSNAGDTGVVAYQIFEPG